MTLFSIPGIPDKLINMATLNNLTNEELARLLEPSTDPVICEILRRREYMLRSGIEVDGGTGWPADRL